MKRVYTGWAPTLCGVISNKLISYFVEGIQQNGGEIISLNLTPLHPAPLDAERILILYEDNNHYIEIMDFLKDKEDNMKKWIKDYN